MKSPLADQQPEYQPARSNSRWRVGPDMQPLARRVLAGRDQMLTSLDLDQADSTTSHITQIGMVAQRRYANPSRPSCIENGVPVDEIKAPFVNQQLRHLKDSQPGN